MRLSTEHIKVPSQRELTRRARIYLDGTQVKFAVLADEEGGVVVRHKPMSEWTSDEFCRVRMFDEWPCITERGVVEIRFRADSPAWIREQYPERIGEPRA